MDTEEWVDFLKILEVKNGRKRATYKILKKKSSVSKNSDNVDYSDINDILGRVT